MQNIIRLCLSWVRSLNSWLLRILIYLNALIWELVKFWFWFILWLVFMEYEWAWMLFGMFVIASVMEGIEDISDEGT